MCLLFDIITNPPEKNPVHLPSCTVYKNWPTASTPLGRITAVAFAPGVQPMLAVANEQGKIRLWEVRG